MAKKMSKEAEDIYKRHFERVREKEREEPPRQQPSRPHENYQHQSPRQSAPRESPPLEEGPRGSPRFRIMNEQSPVLNEYLRSYRQPAERRPAEIQINPNQAVQEGISSIIEQHPRFIKLGHYLARYLDQKTIKDKVKDLIDNAGDRQGDDAKNYVQRGLADYISSGEAFTNRGKKILLNSGNLEEKARGIKGFFSHLFPKFDGSKYLDKTLAAADDMYALFQTGDYAKRMPDLVKSVGTLYDSGFLDVAVETLMSHGLINDKKYNFLKKEVYSRAKEAAKGMVSGVEKYAVREKAAAKYQGREGISIEAIIGVMLGLVILAVNAGITGAVVGTSTKITGSIVAILLIAISSALFLIFSKKDSKNNNLKRRKSK